MFIHNFLDGRGGGYAPMIAIPCPYSKGEFLALPPNVRLMLKLLSPQILDLPSNLREQPIVFNRESIACHLIEMEFVYDPKIPSETGVTRHFNLLTLRTLDVAVNLRIISSSLLPEFKPHHFFNILFNKRNCSLGK